MMSLYKSLTLSVLIILFLGCEAISPMLTKNYFEDFKDLDIPEFTVDDSLESEWESMDKDDQIAVIDSYTTAAISINASDDLFNSLKDQGDDYIDLITAFYRLLLDETSPNSDTSDSDLLIYQKRAKALALIEVYTTEAMAIDGFNSLIIDYTSDQKTESLKQGDFISELFGDENDKNILLKDIKGLVRAGDAIEILGASMGINSKYNDSFNSNVIYKEDAVFFLVTLFANRIIKINETAELTEENILNQLVDGIVSTSNDFGIIKFPQDISALYPNLNTIERYLGEDGAKAYIATGYELPDPNLFFGGAK